MFPKPVALLVAALLIAPWAPAQAAQSGGPPRAGEPEGWSLAVGLAPVFAPAWQGSKDGALSLFPDVRINYRDVLFASVPDGIGWNAVNRDGWRAGPVVKLRFGRDEDKGGSPFLIAGGSDALLGMGDVKAAAEAGGFVEKGFGPRQAWRMKAEVRRGFGGHDGLLADLALNYRARLGRTSLSIGPRATLSSSGFMQTYFGVDAAQAGRTGLARYDASGGILSYGLGGTVIRPLDRRSAMTLFSSLERLGGPAADSPLIRERGQPTQFSIGLGYAFRFRL